MTAPVRYDVEGARRRLAETVMAYNSCCSDDPPWDLILQELAESHKALDALTAAYAALDGRLTAAERHEYDVAREHQRAVHRDHTMTAEADLQHFMHALADRAALLDLVDRLTGWAPGKEWTPHE